MKYLNAILLSATLVTTLFIELKKPENPEPFAIVSVDRLEKFVYRGINNPITIQIPNAKSTKVSAEGLKKLDDYGHYNFLPGPGTKATLQIEAVMANGTKFRDSVMMRIGNIPMRINYFAGKTSNNGDIPKLSAETFDNGKLTIERPYRYQEDFKVKAFTMKAPGAAAIEMKSDSLSPEAMKIIKKLKRGSQVIMYDIKTRVTSNSVGCDKNSPIVLEVL